MSKYTQIVHADHSLASAGTGPERWIEEGKQMARIEGEAVFESIELKHSAESASHEGAARNIEATGSVVLADKIAFNSSLSKLGFDPAEHLRQIANGKLDLWQAVGLLVLSAALAVFVLLAFGPTWLAVLLSLLVLTSALPVEEFFEAYAEQDAFRETIFLILAALALAAQFWIGTVRGLLLAAIAPAGVGPATHALAAGSVILRYTLGIFSLACEVMCGYKLWRARTQLLSSTARAVRQRELCDRRLIGLHAALEGARVEADLRRHYRSVGARQHLAWAPRAAEQTRASHLKRAVKGALIGIAVILAILFLFGTRLSAASPARTTIILPDLSLSVSPESFRANTNAVADILEHLQPGGRALVVGITGSFGQPAILFDKTVPASVGFLGLEQQAGKETLLAEWNSLARQLKPTYARTDIVGGLAVISYLTGAISPGARLFILSDLQQSTSALDLEHLNRIPVKSTISRLKQANAIPALTGMDIFLLGVDPVGKSAEYFQTLKVFWLEFFRESGARVRAFSIDRHVPEL